MGSTINSYRYIIDNGLTTGVNYPYNARENLCEYNKSMKAATVSDYRRVPIMNDEFLRVIE